MNCTTKLLCYNSDNIGLDTNMNEFMFRKVMGIHGSFLGYKGDDWQKVLSGMSTSGINYWEQLGCIGCVPRINMGMNLPIYKFKGLMRT